MLTKIPDSPRVSRYKNGMETDSKVFAILEGSLGMTLRQIADKTGLTVANVASVVNRNTSKFDTIAAPVGYKRERLVWLVK